MALGFVTRASYAASKGTRLLVKREINAAVYAPGATTATTNQRRPLQPAGSIALYEPVSNSTFHALQLTAGAPIRSWLLDPGQLSVLESDRRFFRRQRHRHHADESVRSELRQRSGGFRQDGTSSTCRACGTCPSGSRTALLNSLLGGWSLNGIASLWSGYPFTVASGVDNARTGTGNQRADLIGDPYLSR